MQRAALKERNNLRSYFALSVLNLKFFILTRGVAPRFARRLPLAIISRAFGAAETDSLPTVTSEANNLAILANFG